MSLKESFKHMSWCIKHGVSIYPVTLDNYSYRIVINNNGKIKEGTIFYKIKPKKVNDDRWYNKVYELYTHYYKHYTKNIIEQNKGPDLDLTVEEILNEFNNLKNKKNENNK